ncbi:hypothetical protein RND81_01G204300 [Saponaria officinalis]|uniref:Membrane insertase YidC/Oxa/ALB C-terminal domain-containing protein n=1 Tax=Saponaria officinalis TaxID=3572 RepID=A0AAW1NIP6_SAPOF
MACRQSLTKKATLLRRWYHPSITDAVYHRIESDDEFPSQSRIQSRNGIMHNISSLSGKGRHRFLFGHDRCSSGFRFTLGFRPSFPRYMSTEVGEGSDSVEFLGDAADVLTENTVEVVSSQAPNVSEVAIAAADSAFPVAALQYLIDGVHSFTGLNWWAAIAVTTILIRGATLPFLINQLKATYKLNLIRPRLEEIKQRVQATGMDSTTVADGQKEMKALFAKYGVSPFTPLKGLLIQGPIFVSFFLAITNMVEKVPSFKTGGAFWFTDLTTPDTLCVFPLLASLSFLITVECNVQEGLEGNPMAGTMKNFSRIIAILAVPLTMGFPKALFCYWITSNLFSLSYGLAMKHPEVRNLLDLPGAPNRPVSPASTSESSLQQNKVDRDHTQSSDSSQVADRRSSHSVMQQRIRHLEQHLKANRKNKKK